MNILIPRLNKIKIYGFYPIFDQTVEFNITEYLFLILGGNGLGKTTILQAIIYGIAGPSNENVEPKENKNRRWSRDYFKNRLDNANNASVEVTFFLSNFEVLLKRGFQSDRILEFTLDGKIISNDKQKAEQEFEAFLKSEFGYDKITDFNFLIHKLCYLSEKRENLAWDLDSQVRILMQIFSDTTIENQFRIKRENLKLINSKLRHKNVAINHLQDRINLIKEADEELPSQIPVQNETRIDTDFEEIQNRFLGINSIILEKQDSYKILKSEYLDIVNQVDTLRDVIGEFEKSFFFDHLSKIESNEAKLAIHKLLHKKLCPSCGTFNEELYERAIKYVHDRSCPLCGTIQIVETDISHPAIEAELAEKINIKIELEQKIIAAEKELQFNEARLSELNILINQRILTQQPNVIFIDRLQGKENAETESLENLDQALKNIQFEYNDLQIRFSNLKQELDDEYNTFNNLNISRVSLLSDLYEKYASEFLGIKCTLQQVDSGDKFLNLKLFVPYFNQKARLSPDSCSEAQRFFLDIAFRMAVIDLITELSGYEGTFICETPENALDVSYIENVAKMFQEFSFNNKNTLLMTTNVQSGGIAETLLSKIQGRESRQKLLLNLIEIGKLSTVQSTPEGKNLLDKQIERILGE